MLYAVCSDNTESFLGKNAHATSVSRNVSSREEVWPLQCPDETAELESTGKMSPFSSDI
jgi:hypothetical protein